MATSPYFYKAFLQRDGKPCASGWLYAYASGGSVPKAIFSDATLQTPRDNPIRLDGNGICPQFFTESGLYDFKLYEYNPLTPNAPGELAFTALDIEGAGGSTYSLPIATTLTLGGIKPDGVSIGVNPTTGVASILEDPNGPYVPKAGMCNITGWINMYADINIRQGNLLTGYGWELGSLGMDALTYFSFGGVGYRFTAPVEADTIDANTVTAKSFRVDTVSPDTTPVVGSTYWDEDNKTIATHVANGSILQHGQELVIYARNNSGVTIQDGQCVYITGSSGNKCTIALADADNRVASHILAVATQNISNNSDGYVTIMGRVNDINTAGFAEGAELWLSNTPGGMTATMPDGASVRARVGYVIRSHATQGAIEVAINRFPFFSELSGNGVTTRTGSASLSPTRITRYTGTGGDTETLPTATTISADRYYRNSGTGPWTIAAQAGQVIDHGSPSNPVGSLTLLPGQTLHIYVALSGRWESYVDYSTPTIRTTSTTTAASDRFVLCTAPYLTETVPATTGFAYRRIRYQNAIVNPVSDAWDLAGDFVLNGQNVSYYRLSHGEAVELMAIGSRWEIAKIAGQEGPTFGVDVVNADTTLTETSFSTTDVRTSFVTITMGNPVYESVNRVRWIANNSPSGDIFLDLASYSRIPSGTPIRIKRGCVAQIALYGGYWYLLSLPTPPPFRSRYTGAGGSTTLPAATGSGDARIYRNSGTGTYLISRAGSDVIDAGSPSETVTSVALMPGQSITIVDAVSGRWEVD
jgi:hypothetical protein